MAGQENPFDTSKAELFEALGHPVRVRILKSLEEKPKSFSELKREVRIESSGHLQFHLGKLSGLIGTSADGSYVLTDDGREALRVLNLSTRESEAKAVAGRGSLGEPRWTKPLIACLLIVIITLAGALVYQQQQIAVSSATPTPLLWCPGVVAWNTETNTSAVPVLSMEPGSTAYACVVYQTAWQGNATKIGDLFVRPAEANASQTPKFQPYQYPTALSMANVGCSPSSPPSSCFSDVTGMNNFRTEASPATVELTASTDYFRVMYTITALGNSTGYYNRSLPYTYASFCPESMWIVVGQPTSQKPSDFGTVECPVGGPGMQWEPVVVSVSVDGMGVTYNYPFAHASAP